MSSLTPLPLPKSDRQDVKLRLIAVEGGTSEHTGLDFITLTLRVTGTYHVVWRRLPLKEQTKWVHKEAHHALAPRDQALPSSYDLNDGVAHFTRLIGRMCLGDLRVSERFKVWDIRRLRRLH